MGDEERGQAPVSDLMSALLRAQEGSGEGALSRRAATAWFRVNGDIERAHTVCVIVRPARRAQDAPVLIVYVDSRSRAVDFSVNREIYLGRMAMAGLEFSEVRFLENRRPAPEPAPRHRGPAAPEPAAAPLTEADRARIAELCSMLPESLRESVSRAMSSSWSASRTK